MNVSQVDTMDPVRVLHIFGQSVWMDYIRRNFMTSGELRRVIVEEGISGVTSEPWRQAWASLDGPKDESAWREQQRRGICTAGQPGQGTSSR